MPRKLRAIRRSLGPVTHQVAELIAHEIDARVGPNATFAEYEAAAAAVAAEVAAELAASAARASKVGG